MFKRLIATLAIVTMLIAPAISAAQDTSTPEDFSTATPIVDETPVPVPPVEPAPEPLPPFFDLTEIVLTIVAVAALILVGLDRREFQRIANILLDAPPAWLVTLFLDLANRGFDEATRKAGTTPTPMDDEAIRVAREEFQRIVDEWRSGLPPVVVQAIAAEVHRQQNAAQNVTR